MRKQIVVAVVFLSILAAIIAVSFRHSGPPVDVSARDVSAPALQVETVVPTTPTNATQKPAVVRRVANKIASAVDTSAAPHLPAYSPPPVHAPKLTTQLVLQLTFSDNAVQLQAANVAHLKGGDNATRSVREDDFVAELLDAQGNVLVAQRVANPRFAHSPLQSPQALAAGEPTEAHVAVLLPQASAVVRLPHHAAATHLRVRAATDLVSAKGRTWEIGASVAAQKSAASPLAVLSVGSMATIDITSRTYQFIPGVAANHAIAIAVQNGSTLHDLQIVSQTTHGVVTLDVQNRRFSYVSESGYKGEDSFTVRAYDGSNWTTAVTMTMRAYTVTKLQGSEDGSGTDLVIIGDGFQEAEMLAFHQAATNAANRFLAYEPMTTYQASVNVFFVDVYSRQSGIRRNQSDTLDTAFSLFFNCGNIERLLCIGDGDKANAIVFGMLPQADQILVLGNSSTYGGAGGGIATASLNSASAEIAVHELGHSLAGLADEYDYGGSSAPSVEPMAPNVTINNNAATVKWQHWIGRGGKFGTSSDVLVGLHEGGYYVTEGVWRPTQNSMMRALGNPFHAVNAEVWAIEFHRRAGSIIDTFLPVNSQLLTTPGTANIFQITPSVSAVQKEIIWRVNGVVADNNSADPLQFVCCVGETNNYSVSAELRDNSGYILKDDSHNSTKTISWYVTLNQSGDFDGDGISDNDDPDDDNDGVADVNDALPYNANESIDTDGDFIGNNTDNDDDNDGVADINDAFPVDATETSDFDHDGIGNNADSDDDNDSVADTQDAFPLDAAETVDTDSDGVGNNTDSDDDNDGHADTDDDFPLDPARWQANNNRDSGGGGSVSLFMIVLAALAIFRKRETCRKP